MTHIENKAENKRTCLSFEGKNSHMTSQRQLGLKVQSMTILDVFSEIKCDKGKIVFLSKSAQRQAEKVH